MYQKNIVYSAQLNCYLAFLDRKFVSFTETWEQADELLNRAAAQLRWGHYWRAD